jgi:broad specificity phosphatase PhoE
MRHGTTSANNPKAERLRGWSNIGLSEKGVREAHAAGEWLRNKRINLLWHSPLRRVKQTVAEVIKSVPVTPRENGQLLDWNTGTMEGMLVEAMKPMMDFFTRHPAYAVPEGESYGEYWQRWRKSFADICDYAAKNPNEKLLVVTHARNIATLQHRLKGGTIGPVSYDHVPHPCGIMEVTTDGKTFNMRQVYGNNRSDDKDDN